MTLKKGQLVTLTDNKEYIVMATVCLNDEKYIFLVEDEKNENMKFCFEEIENNLIKLTEVNNLSLIQKILMKFAKEFKEQNNNN